VQGYFHSVSMRTFFMSRRLSPDAKAMRGTIRPDREHAPSALIRLERAPPAPQYLSDRARLEWEPLAAVCCELGCLTDADLRALALLAECLATEHQLREVLQREGMCIAGSGQTRKSHPATKMLESARSQAMRLLECFGLTPRSRLGIDIRPARTKNIFSNNGNRSPLPRLR
jgi:P27 family predicted phage terminase small subunit